jgi:hypothetical protein
MVHIREAVIFYAEPGLLTTPSSMSQTAPAASQEQLLAGLNAFKEAMAGYADYAFANAKRWKCFYWSSRSLLILFGILTTTDAALAVPVLSLAKPYLGLAVALITGYEVFFQPVVD